MEVADQGVKSKTQDVAGNKTKIFSLNDRTFCSLIYRTKLFERRNFFFKTFLKLSLLNFLPLRSTSGPK